MPENKIVRVSLAGGIIGSLFTNPRQALAEYIRKENLQGWRAVHFDHHRDNNALVSILRLLVLIFTGGLWTWKPGYLILFERKQQAFTAHGTAGPATPPPPTYQRSHMAP